MTRARSSTTPRTGSVGSPPPRRGRSSCSACATPRTSRSSASSGPRGRRRLAASSSRATTRAPCSSTSARSRPCCRRPSRCRASATCTATGCAATSSASQRGPRGPQIELSRTHPNLVRKLFAPRGARRSPTARSRSRRWPARPATAPRSPSTRTVPGVNAKGACIGPMGARVRAVMTELHGEKIDIVDYSPTTRRPSWPRALSPARVHSVEIVDPAGARRPRDRPGLPAVARDRQGGAERPPRRQAHRLAHRHPPRHPPPTTAAAT